MFLKIQRQFGNASVQRFLATENSSEKGDLAQRQLLNEHENNPAELHRLDVDDLFALYPTNRQSMEVGPLILDPRLSYTREWIRGDGKEEIRNEIRSRLEDLRQAVNIEELQRLRNLSRSVSGSGGRKRWLRRAVDYRLRRVQLLTSPERTEMIRFTGNRIDRAFTAFNTALTEEMRHIREAAQARAEMISMIFGLMLGFMVPGIGRGIAALANSLPASASVLSHRIGLLALNADRNAAILGAATEVGKNYVKDGATNVQGVSEVEAFSNELRNLYHAAFDRIDENLPNLTDFELIVMRGAFAPGATNFSAWSSRLRDLLTRYRQQIQPIGQSSFETEYMSATQRETFAAWIGRGSRRRLALVSSSTQYGITTHTTYHFVRWIDRDMQQMAIAKEGSVRTLRRNQISSYSRRRM